MHILGEETGQNLKPFLERMHYNKKVKDSYAIKSYLESCTLFWLSLLQFECHP